MGGGGVQLCLRGLSNWCVYLKPLHAGRSEPQAQGLVGNIVFRPTVIGCSGIFSIGSLTAGGVLAVDPRLQRIVQNALYNKGIDTMPPVVTTPADIVTTLPPNS